MKRHSDGTPVRRFKLAFYDAPPTEEITTEDFEELGIGRMNLLKDVQRIKGSSLPFPDECRDMRSLTDGAAPIDTEKDRGADRIAHFLARMICCSHEGLRGWFEKNEAVLFSHRILREDVSETVLRENLQALPLSPEEFLAWKVDLLAVEEMNGGGRGSNRRYSAMRDYVKVPFERVLYLVGSRKVLLRAGNAVVRRNRMNSVLSQGFRENLAEGTKIAAANWERSAKAFRILGQLRERFLRELCDLTDRRAEAPRSGRLPLRDLAATSRRHFPPCMLSLYGQLASDRHHLKFQSRFRLATFLKTAGLSLEDAKELWMAGFTKEGVGNDKLRKYRSQLEKVYSSSYHPTGCRKMTTEKCTVGESCGCPLSTVHASEEKVREYLEGDGMGEPDVEDLMGHVGRGCARTACRRYLEVRTGTKTTTLEGMGNPNQFLAMSLSLRKSSNASPITEKKGTLNSDRTKNNAAKV